MKDKFTNKIILFFSKLRQEHKKLFSEALGLDSLWHSMDSCHLYA